MSLFRKFREFSTVGENISTKICDLWHSFHALTEHQWTISAGLSARNSLLYLQSRHCFTDCCKLKWTTLDSTVCVK